MAMGTNPVPYLVEDFQGVIQVYSDGTVIRSTQKIDVRTPLVHEDSVIFKDCLFDETHDLHLRLYKPKPPPSAALNDMKLPVLVYLYGGGFCVGSRARPKYHYSCLRLSSRLNALVVAPDTRLAPESKVPEAVEDGARAMKWLQGQALNMDGDAWLNSGEVDFGRVFVVGDSSGGNIAHHLAVGLGAGSGELEPLRVRGYVMMSPFFGGVARTRSEEGPRESALTLEILDHDGGCVVLCAICWNPRAGVGRCTFEPVQSSPLIAYMFYKENRGRRKEKVMEVARFWKLCIPKGETRDHPLVNPFGPTSPNLGPRDLDPILCIVGGRELLKDRAQDYATRLKALGKKIEYVELEGKQHGYFTDDPYSEYANEVLGVIGKFIFESCY